MPGMDRTLINFLVAFFGSLIIGMSIGLLTAYVNLNFNIVFKK